MTGRAVRREQRLQASVAPRRCACGGLVGPTGECAACRAKRLRRETANGTPKAVEEVLRSPGRPLEPGVKERMESHFGHDFSRVRVHTDPRAAESARAVSANAYAVGQHVAFAAGRYAPGTPAGDRLLAHELAHVRQQSGATERLEIGRREPGTRARGRSRSRRPDARQSRSAGHTARSCCATSPPSVRPSRPSAGRT